MRSWVQVLETASCRNAGRGCVQKTQSGRTLPWTLRKRELHDDDALLAAAAPGGDILKGAALAGAVFRETGIPVLCHMAEERFLPGLKKLREPVFPITIRMKKPWE